jgi:CheY-like chemotaxis protein
MKNILIADDEKTLLLSLSEGLRFYDNRFRVYTAKDGQEAIDVLNSRHIDLLITDLKMPNLDGFDLLALALRKFPDLPVIVVTAYSNPDIDRKLQALGITRCMEKPLEFNEFVTQVVSVLGGSSGNRPFGMGLSHVARPSDILQFHATNKESEG